VIAEVTVGPRPDSTKADAFLRFGRFQIASAGKTTDQNIAGSSVFGARGNDTLIAQSFNLNQIKPLQHFFRNG